MASKSVVDAVMGRVAGWGGPPIVGPNSSSETPGDGSSFIRVDYPLADSLPWTFGAPGSNIYREEGVFRFVIHVPRHVGVDDGLVWADQLAALFRGKEFDGVQTFAPSPPAIDDDSENGMYFVLAVAVPYQFDLIG